MSRSRTERASIFDDASPAFVLISRVLVVLITLLLAMIPWSERYHTLDSFPHGQDTELNLLALFVFVGLILLFVRAGKKRLRSFLATRFLLISIIRPALALVPGAHHGLALAESDDPPHPGSSLDLYNLPLQI